ncbi:MAG: hypothetical protein A2452_10145 [Candidatus Firestonebacteria bacterium RIFOXYC2_FULL_39_67]|nr:MAG: hypothetical protein A2536_06515 [Candidatus Firestonebacteria bacterium RIFOXYD2_FULL_39_29]OGF54264.1 MAG: hypothetical protein A2452_10145 [Candidatus Firestonebacteria bacterium RIFOXYC2_FULL_39_67]OGF56890.1 MAG: hypothetical protein A2497_06075 [Candidatus Firestonebacteria bacterium RifOxyC12_full_39_7]
MTIKNGDILFGNIEKLLSYGAFVALPEGKSGLLHVSEFKTGFIGNIKDHLSVGQELMVKVIGINEEGKISLSLKALEKTDSLALSSTEEIRPSRLFGRTGTAINEDKDFDEQLKKFSRRNMEKTADIKKQFYGKTGKRRK